MRSVRPVAITLLSIGLTAASLIAVHGLWERRGGGRAADQGLFFDAATTVTVVPGVLSLYLALPVLAVAEAGLVITPDAFSAALGRDEA